MGSNPVAGIMLTAKKTGKGNNLYHRFQPSLEHTHLAKCGARVENVDLGSHEPDPPAERCCKVCFPDSVPSEHRIRWRLKDWPEDAHVELVVRAKNNFDATLVYKSLFGNVPGVERIDN